MLADHCSNSKSAGDFVMGITVTNRDHWVLNTIREARMLCPTPVVTVPAARKTSVTVRPKGSYVETE
jgi:hypothetical protein